MVPDVIGQERHVNSRIKDRCFQQAASGWNPFSPISLYIHFPFCARKCLYCDFVSGPGSEAEICDYLEVLEVEIRAKAKGLTDLLGNAVQVDTIFFGGGTPSLMNRDQLDHLLFVIYSCFQVDDDAEITLECNPGTANKEKLCAFQKSGINRLSVGVQSFRDEELELLGRIHTSEEAYKCILTARESGFSNISLDLISALPGQTYEQWMFTLQRAVELEPDHISAYSLILEEGTPLASLYEQDKLPPLPKEDIDRKMYHDTLCFLKEFGYERYEISNYARKGFESRHNNGYWTGHPYLGLGTAAASYLILPWNGSTHTDGFDKIRWTNPSNRKEYCRKSGEEARHPSFFVPEDAEVLSRNDQISEFMFLGLRRMEGIREMDFENNFACTIDSLFEKPLRRYEKLELLKREDGHIFLTEKGIDVSNTIMADFLLDF